MRRFSLLTLLVVGCCSLIAVSAKAQHADLEFDLVGGNLTIFNGEAANIDATIVFDRDMPSTGFTARHTGDPGFASEDDEGFGNLNPGETISLEFLESTTHGGFLQYHDGTDLVDAFVGELHVSGNATSSAPQATIEVEENALVGGSEVAIQEVLGTGEVHAHVDFDLRPDLNVGDPGAPAFGAYGALARLTSSNSSVGDSAPFWLVYNYGLSEEDFEEAVEGITGASHAIPEPGTTSLGVLAGLIGVALRRRKRGSV